MAWLSAKEVAQLLSVSERAVQISAQKNKYVCRHVEGIGRGGKVLQIALESLPPAAQARYNGEQEDNPVPIFEDYFSKYTGKQRAEADHRADILSMFQNSGLTGDKFVNEYNALGNDQISTAQLYYWQRKFKKGGLEALIDRRGGHNRGQCAIPPKAWDLFLEYRLTPQKRSTKLCYDLVKREFPDIPSVSVFERQFRQVRMQLKIKTEQGDDAYQESFPFLERDYSSLKSNEVWCLDHHLADVLVRNRKGHIVRLWITVIMDVRSRKIISCIARDAYPNKIAIKKGLRIGFEKYGIPETLQTDNGKDYLSDDLDPDLPYSLLSMLGIGKIVSLPYHGSSKGLERFFSTFEGRFGKRFYSYIGNDGKNRPDYLSKRNQELESDPNIPDMDTYISLMDAWIENEYATTVHSGDSMDNQSPNEVYLQNLDVIKKVENMDALHLLCGERRERTVRKNGVELQGRFYRGNPDKLCDYYGKRVFAYFDPDNFDTLYLFNMDLKFICSVDAVAKTMWRDTTYQDYIEAQKARKIAKKVIREQEPASRLSIIETISKQQLAEKRFEEELEEKEKIPVVTQPYTEAQKAFEDKSEPKGRKENIFAKLYDCYKNHA